MIQDGLYYDKFAYEIKSNVNFLVYKDLFNQLVHPTGYNVFNRLKIETTPPLDFGERSSRTEIKSLESEVLQPGGVYQWKNHPDATDSPDFSPTFVGSRLGDVPETSRPDEKILTTVKESTTRDNYSFRQSPGIYTYTLLNTINQTTDVSGGTDFFMEDFTSSSPALRSITISGLTTLSTGHISARGFRDNDLNGTYLPATSLSPAIMNIAYDNSKNATPNNRVLSSSFDSPLKTPVGGKINDRYYWIKNDVSENCPSIAMLYYSSPRWKVRPIHTSNTLTGSLPGWQTTGNPYFKDIPPTKGWIQDGTGTDCPSYTGVLNITYGNIVTDSFGNSY